MSIYINPAHLLLSISIRHEILHSKYILIIVDKFDGHNLWFKITEDEANNTYRSVEEIL
jgi:hypothetical protein